MYEYPFLDDGIIGPTKSHEIPEKGASDNFDIIMGAFAILPYLIVL